MLNLLIQSGEKMLKIDRHSYILDELKTKHLVRVSKLAHDMKVTEMTIRRDLQELEDYGHLTRIHGGAKLKPKNFYQEDNYNKKISVNVEEKKQIARKVADLIKDNETIFIGPSYDSTEEWTRIPETGHFTVEVPSINVRNKPSKLGKVTNTYYKGERIYYDSYVIKEGFVWISYISYSGERHYVATGTHNGSERTSTWGSFRE